VKSNIAVAQYRLSQDDLELVLALVRGGSLARAADLLSVDVSTVFRAIRKLEKRLGAMLFDKARAGYLPTDLARAMANHAEQAEAALASARRVVEGERDVVHGTVRLTCTDSVLHGLLVPALRRFMPDYPLLTLELVTSNDFANLSRHDADVALRLTTTPPPHLVGRSLGDVPYLLCAPAGWSADVAIEAAPWIAPDDFLPDHATVAWRRQRYPGVQPRYRCNSILSVRQLIEAGQGIGALPSFLALANPAVQVLGEPLPACTTALWMLTRPDCRSLRSVSVLFEQLARHVRLPDMADVRQ
jgi:DNA-binding transcriptional LysR family regulator